jgi:hypothetical protein
MLPGRGGRGCCPGVPCSHRSTLTRRANLLICRYPCGRPDPFRSVRDLGLVSPGCPDRSGASEGCSSVWLPAWLPDRAATRALLVVFKSMCDPTPVNPLSWTFRLSALWIVLDHPVYIPRPAIAPLSPRPYRETACTVQGMARVRSGQAAAWPLVSDRSVRRGSGVKRDFACTFTSRFHLCLLSYGHSGA